MNADRIEKAARALAFDNYEDWAKEKFWSEMPDEDRDWVHEDDGGVHYGRDHYRRIVEIILASLGLLDGSAWIAPWEASDAMLDEVMKIENALSSDPMLNIPLVDYWRAMRDAALSAPEST